MEDNNEEVVTRNNLQNSKRPRLRFLRYILAILLHIGFAIFISFFTFATHLLNKKETEYLQTIHVWYTLAHFLIQIPAAIYSYKFSAIRLFGICIIGNSILTFLFPIIIHNGWHQSSILIIIIPVFIQGLFMGAAGLAIFSIWPYWAPPLERSTLMAIACTGYYTGPLIFELLLKLDSFNLEYILYVYGSMGIVWYFIWFWLAFEHPSQHPSITDQELTYLQRTISIKHVTPIPSIPWKNILKNMSIVTLIIVTYSNSFGYQTATVLCFRLDRYLKPEYFVPLIATLVTGFAADLILQKTSFSTTILRKIYICSGLTLLSLLILCMLFFEIYYESNWVPLMAYLTMSAYSLASIGISVNYLDTAHKYAGIVVALANLLQKITVFGRLAYLYLPEEFFEYLDEYKSNTYQFRVFRALLVILAEHGILNILRILILPIILISAACLYLIFGTSKQQNLQNKKSYAVISMESTQQNLQDPEIPLASAPLSPAVY